MKKTLIAVLAIAMFVAAFGGVTSAYAMSETGKGPGNGGGGNGGGGNGSGTATAAAGANGTSILSDYMNTAVADALGLDAATVADRLAAGETFYDIAISMGYTAETWPELLASVQAAATEAAAADGLTPQQQSQLNTNLGTHTQIQDGTCDGTADCTQTDYIPATSLYTGANAGVHGGRGGGRR